MTICGKNIKIDKSGGQGHCWGEAEYIPASIVEEIEGEIIDGEKEHCSDFLAGNGQHYRW